MMDTHQPDIATAFPPPKAAAMLYPGNVMHARLNPFGHRFNYKVFTLLIDLDRLAEAARSARFFSVNRRNLVAFHEADHLPKDDSSQNKSLAAYARGLVMAAGAPAPHRVLLMAYPRLMGFVFNPLSVYFCYDKADALTCAIYEVSNTFGERHTYVCPVEPGQLNAAGLRQERTKIFYVSPFIDMGTRYHFRILPPGDDVRLRIFETEAGKPLLSATFSGSARPMNSAVLAALVARLPFMTLKVMAGIHWEALKLWIKGAKFHSRGKPPIATSFDDVAAGPAK